MSIIAQIFEAKPLFEQLRVIVVPTHSVLMIVAVVRRGRFPGIFAETSDGCSNLFDLGILSLVPISLRR